MGAQVLHFFFILCFGLSSALGANPFRVEVSPANGTIGTEATATVTFVIPKKYHMYRDMMGITVTSAESANYSIGTPVFPVGICTPIRPILQR